MEWILHPAVQCLIQIATLLACLDLFLGLKRELREAARRSRECSDILESRIELLRTIVEEMGGQLRRVDEKADRLVEPPPTASSLNISKRSQAIRMHRRGEAPGQIAAALCLPQQEVELLLKVEKAAMESC